MSTVYAVDLVFRSKGVNQLAGLTSKTKDLDRAARKAQGGVDKASNSVRRFDRSARAARSGVSTLIGTLGRLAAAYGAVRIAQSAIQAGIQRTESERRIKFLAREYGEVAQLSAAAGQAAEKFGLSQTEANKALATTYARLRPVGVSLKDINSVYAGFNTAAKLSGATAVETTQAFRQLAQALGSGALRGDEFRSVAEQAPLVLQAVSKETGIAVGQLRDYAAEGLITSDVVIRALKRIEREGAAQLAEAMNGPEQAIKDFQNAAEDVQVALTKSIIPEIAAAFRELAIVIKELEGPLTAIGGLMSNTLKEARLMIQAVKGQGNAINTLRSGKLPFLGAPGANKQMEEFFGKERFAELKNQAREMAKATGDSYSEALKKRLIAALNVIDKAKEIRALQGGGTGSSPAAAVTGTTPGTGTGTGTGTESSTAQELSNRERLLAAADAQLGNLAGISEQCANAIRDIYEAAGIKVGTSLNPYDQSDERGLPQGGSFASSLAGPEVGKRILLSDLKPGDLIAFENTYGNFGKDIQTHVGMYAGDGMMYDHSSSKGLTKRSVDTFSKDKQMFGIRPYALEGSGGGDAFTAQLANEEELEKLAERRKEQAAERLASAKELLAVNEAELAIKQEMNPLVVADLESAERKRQIEQEYASLIEQATEATTVQTLEQAKGVELQLEDVKLEKEKKKLQEAATKSIQSEIEMLKARLNGTQDVLEAERQIAQLRSQGVSGEAASALVETRTQLKKQVEAQDAARASAEQLSGSIANSLTGSLRGLIDGSMTAEEALQNAFQGIADSFLDMAMQMIQKWIQMQLMGLVGSFFGGGGGMGGGMGGAFSIGLASFAGGGYTGDSPRSGGIDGQGGFLSVLHPQETVVDHFGDARAAISSESAMAALSSESGMAEGDSYSSSESSTNSAFSDNRRSISNVKSVYQTSAETKTYQEAVSAMTSGGGAVVIETEVINNVEYATVDQMEKSNQVVAERTRAEVFAEMQNSVGLRKRIGL